MKITKLESLRGFAAVYVMLSHLSSNYLHLQHTWIGQPFRFAQEGVLLFFLLSGFVIYFSWHEHPGKKDFGHFFYKRFRRLYPIFLVSLALAWAATCARVGFVPPDWHGLLANLCMTQGFENDPGWQAQAFMSNGPLWSLSYEWWFYMMFYPLYAFVPMRCQRVSVLTLSLVGVAGSELAPNLFFHILASFPIWWCGVEFAHEWVETKNFTLRRQSFSLTMLVIVGLAHAAVVYGWHHDGRPLDIINYPLVKLRHYVVGIALVLLFFAWRKAGFVGFRWTIGPFEIFAGMSYAIYVLHFPIICVLPEFGPPDLFYPEVVGKVLLVLILAYVAEEVWQKHVNRWMDRHILGKKQAKLTPSH